MALRILVHCVFPTLSSWVWGEALANYKATMGAVHRLIDPSPEGLGISARGLTMSTVGLVPGHS